ncbi:TPA: hypothetical protein I8Z33_001285 [Legionella pneumophila]|nr:hypothetical protein [Legionella pneumophila]
MVGFLDEGLLAAYEATQWYGVSRVSVVGFLDEGLLVSLVISRQLL